jgi:hypothetical protein
MVALRVLRTTQLTVSRTFTVDGVPTEPSGAVTVAVKRWDGTTVGSGTATAPGSPGVRAFVLTGGLTAPAMTYQLDNLTMTWSANVGGSNVELSQEVQVVGGHYFDLETYRGTYRDYASPAKFPSATLAEKRVGVEDEVEAITWRAFVPRFAVDTVYGNGSPWITLSHCEPRVIRSVTAQDGTQWTADQVAAIQPMDNGWLKAPNAGIWPGIRYTIEYEHGLDSPPLSVAEASMLRMSIRMGRPNSGIPHNAQSYTTEAGAIYRLAAGGKGKTGVADVDSDLAKYTRKRSGAFA